jgi:hypothetical protein
MLWSVSLNALYREKHKAAHDSAKTRYAKCPPSLRMRSVFNRNADHAQRRTYLLAEPLIGRAIRIKKSLTCSPSGYLRLRARSACDYSTTAGAETAVRLGFTGHQRVRMEPLSTDGVRDDDTTQHDRYSQRGGQGRRTRPTCPWTIFGRCGTQHFDERPITITGLGWMRRWPTKFRNAHSAV